MPALGAVHQTERQSARGRRRGTEIVEAHLPPGSAGARGANRGTENVGGALMTARKWASGVWEGEKRVGEGPPTADALVERKKGDEGMKGYCSTDAATYLVLVVRSVDGYRHGPPPAPVEMMAFEPCMLTTPTERGVSFVLVRSRASVAVRYRWHRRC